MNSKKLYTLSGVTTLLASTAVLLDYASRLKNKGRKSYFGEFLAGAIGLGIGFCLAYTPKRQEKHPIDRSEFFDDQSEDEVKDNIREVLGESVDRGPVEEKPQSVIEVDRDASIEDFM